MTCARGRAPYDRGVYITHSRARLKCIAWCPDDCDESAAREYVGSTPREIAEQHAEHVYYEQGTRRECYEVRVRATKGDRVREWDVTVDVEVEVSFSATLAFPRKVSKEHPGAVGPRRADRIWSSTSPRTTPGSTAIR